jgi:Mrp family chromosome partitioning ATPase
MGAKLNPETQPDDVRGPSEVEGLPTSEAPDKSPTRATVVCRPRAAHYDALMAQVCPQRDEADAAGYLVGLLGCGPCAGVSTITANLAIRAADHGLSPVLVVDANPQRPIQHRLFGTSARRGFADVVAGKTALAAAVERTMVDGLELLPFGERVVSGKLPSDPAICAGIIYELRERYLRVFVDLPDVRDIGPVLWLASALDAAIVVVRADRVRRDAAQLALDRLNHGSVPVIGAVVNDERRYLPNWLERLL